MSSLQLKAEKREKLGSLEAKRLKKSGQIPAIVQSKAGNLNIALNKREFDVEFQKGNIQTRIIEIELDGKKIKAITNRVELDPVSDQIIHIDMMNCEDGALIKAWPKVKFLNREKSPGIKRGGFLNIRSRKIEVLCESETKIPEFIEIDIAKLQVGDKLRSSQIKLPEGVKFSKNAEFLIASVTGRGKAEEETKTDGAGSAEGEEDKEGDKKEESKEEEKK